MRGTPYRGDAGHDDQVAADVRTAFAKWSRGIFGAPRQLDTQITHVEERDEMLTRVATEIARRDLIQHRIPTQRAKKKKNAAEVDPRTIDPFSESPEDLRDRTEHTEPCANCVGSGVVVCPTCGGGGRQPCGGCGGSGQVLRRYQKSSRFVRCTVCRGGGTVACGGCGAKGTVACGGCAGSGTQLVWWGYGERVRIVVGFAHESAILEAHPHLRDERFLGPEDLKVFTPFAKVEARESISEDELDSEDAVELAKLMPPTDRQLERIRSQQFVRFGVLRRDVRYEMCGTEATVVLAGSNLVGARTSAGVGPIRRRLMGWGVAAVLLIILASASSSALGGPTVYFESVNRSITIALLIGIIAAVVGIGGVLRSLRPGFRFWSFRLADRIAGILLAIVVIACPLLSFAGRPNVEEARSALAKGDIKRAEMVAEALAATQPDAGAKDLLDELRLAKAEHLQGDARLTELDQIAATTGNQAEEAKKRAHDQRLNTIQEALAQNHPDEALRLLDLWATQLAPGESASELRAQAFDMQASLCSNDVCRYTTAQKAQKAQATPERSAAVERARTALISGLMIGGPPKADQLEQLRALRTLAELAVSVQAVASEDTELLASARSSLAWATGEREKTQLIGAPVAVVEELLERTNSASPTVGVKGLEGVAVYTSTSGGQCKGLYVVGAAPGARALSGKETALQRLIAQTTGNPQAQLRGRPDSQKSHDVSKWVEGGTPIVARYSDYKLMELRIGDAAP